MSSWRSPPLSISVENEWFWKKVEIAKGGLTSSSGGRKSGKRHNSSCYNNFFEVQEYVGAWGYLLRTVKSYDPTHYRIITTIRPQTEIAIANSKETIEQMLETLHTDVIPHLSGLSASQVQSVLPSLVEKLHHKNDIKPMLQDWEVLDEAGFIPTDLTGVISGLQKDSLEISVTFEYSYTQPPPLELCCNTCNQPAIDPHVSPVFPGKLFCASCMMFEFEGKLAVGDQRLAFPAPSLATMLDDLEVYCPFSKFGCRVSLPRGQLNRHLEECAFVCIICVNRHLGCNFGAKTKAEAIEHMSSCQYSSAICKELTESFAGSMLPLPSSPPMYSSPQNYVRLHQHDIVKTEISGDPNRCRCCFANRTEIGEKDCKYHPGTWHSFSYEQVQTMKFEIWKHRVSDGLKCVVHYPVEIAKSTSVVGVSVFAFKALLSTQYVLMFGGLLLVLPSWITAPILATLLSPSLLYKLFYTTQYNFLWGSKDSSKELIKADHQSKWTCCGKVGSNALPCERKAAHVYE